MGGGLCHDSARDTQGDDVPDRSLTPWKLRSMTGRGQSKMVLEVPHDRRFLRTVGILQRFVATIDGQLPVQPAYSTLRTMQSACDDKDTYINQVALVKIVFIQSLISSHRPSHRQIAQAGDRSARLRDCVKTPPRALAIRHFPRDGCSVLGGKTSCQNWVANSYTMNRLGSTGATQSTVLAYARDVQRT